MKHIFTLFFALLSIFSEAQDTLFQQTIPITPHPFSATKIRNDLHIDASGNYWLAFEKSGLGKFNGSSWSFFDTIGNVLPVLKVNHVTTDIAGNIFAGTSEGLSVFNGTNWQHFNSSNSSLPASGVTTVETNGIDTWIGTNTGIYKYTIGSFTIPPVLMSLTIHPITCIAFGINGEIFTGTTNGIYKYLGSFTSIPTSSLPSQYIIDIAVNGSNELWVSDTLGNLFYRDSVTFIYKSILPLTAISLIY